MTYILLALFCAITFWKLGRKYQDFQDLMLARRVAKLIDQREQITKEREQLEKWEKQDKRLNRGEEVEV